MQTWICLLRAVNLGTRNKVSTPRLRPALEAAGLSDVRTYLQSGIPMMMMRKARSEAKRLPAGFRHHTT